MTRGGAARSRRDNRGGGSDRGGGGGNHTARQRRGREQTKRNFHQRPAHATRTNGGREPVRVIPPAANGRSRPAVDSPPRHRFARRGLEHHPLAVPRRGCCIRGGERGSRAAGRPPGVNPVDVPQVVRRQRRAPAEDETRSPSASDASGDAVAYRTFAVRRSHELPRASDAELCKPPASLCLFEHPTPAAVDPSPAVVAPHQGAGRTRAAAAAAPLHSRFVDDATLAGLPGSLDFRTPPLRSCGRASSPYPCTAVQTCPPRRLQLLLYHFPPAQPPRPLERRAGRLF